VRIPTLGEVFERYPDTHLVIELKTDGGPAIIQPVIDLVVEHDRADSVTIASFDEDYLAPVREQLPDVPTNMPESEAQAFYLRQLVGLHPWWEPPGELFQVPETHDLTLPGFTIDDVTVPTRRFVHAAERLGVDVQVWTVNEVEQMHRLLDAGVHGILTDYPDRLVEVLAEREAERGTARGEDLSATTASSSGPSASRRTTAGSRRCSRSSPSSATRSSTCSSSRCCTGRSAGGSACGSA
jgi:glycerophosphoryl diester phosphodiesterase